MAVWNIKLSFVTLSVDSLRNSNPDIYEGDLHNRQQYRDWHWEAFAILCNICFVHISHHRVWIGFRWHWIKYVVLYLLCLTDKTLISTSFHLMIGQSARTLQTYNIELNWIIYQKILWVLAFWLTDFADKGRHPKKIDFFRK